MKKQCLKLLAALKNGPLTSLDIHTRLGIYRASARIYDLRGEGERIATERVTVANRDGQPCSVARYALLPNNDPNRDLWDTEDRRHAA